ncbi:MAG: phosphodiesterase [Rhodospirillales bacterium]|nr:phosphodiesterase [Rhodospirillales bacterium]
MLICQLTDLHIRPFGLPANRTAETNMLVERAFRTVAALRPRPDVVLITGDLTECGLDAEYEQLRVLLRRCLDLPVYVVPGNHDRRENFRRHLGDLPGVTSDPEFVHYAIEDHPVRIVMLDTVVPGAGHGELCAARLDFLDRTLAAQPDKPTIIAMHHPAMICGIAHMDRIALRDQAAFRDIVARHPQVERILCGHHHRAITSRVAQAILTVAPSAAHQVEMTLDPEDPGAFVFEPSAFLLHRWTPADGIATHTVYVERFPGPFPFVTDPDYPGRAEK